MVSQNRHRTQNDSTDAQAWFDCMVANLRYDQTLLEIDVLEAEKREIYDAMISGDTAFVHGYAKDASSVFFITHMVEAYFAELFSQNGCNVSN